MSFSMVCKVEFTDGEVFMDQRCGQWVFVRPVRAQMLFISTLRRSNVVGDGGCISATRPSVRRCHGTATVCSVNDPRECSVDLGFDPGS